MLLRRARPGDEDAVAAVHVRSWQAAYRGLVPDGYLDGMRPEDRAARYAFAERGPGRPATVAAPEHDVITGFATIGPSRDADSAGNGELYAIYVDPGAWGRGVGRVLIGEARSRLAGLGFDTALLRVLDGNRRAELFYRADGWQPDGSQRLADHDGLLLDEIRYRRALP